MAPAFSFENGNENGNGNGNENGNENGNGNGNGNEEVKVIVKVKVKVNVENPRYFTMVRRRGFALSGRSGQLGLCFFRVFLGACGAGFHLGFETLDNLVGAEDEGLVDGRFDHDEGIDQRGELAMHVGEGVERLLG